MKVRVVWFGRGPAVFRGRLNVGEARAVARWKARRIGYIVARSTSSLPLHQIRAVDLIWILLYLSPDCWLQWVLCIFMRYLWVPGNKHISSIRESAVQEL